MRARHFALLLLVCAALTGCGGDEEPRAIGSPPPTAAEIAYYDCLKKEGVAVVYTDYGSPREDKSKPWNEAAHQACASMIPPPPAPVRASPEELAAARKESACLRAEGVTWYPDPDPVTAEIDDSGATAEQWATFKQQHIEALRACRPDR